MRRTRPRASADTVPAPRRSGRHRGDRFCSTGSPHSRNASPRLRSACLQSCRVLRSPAADPPPAWKSLSFRGMSWSNGARNLLCRRPRRFESLTKRSPSHARSESAGAETFCFNQGTGGRWPENDLPGSPAGRGDVTFNEHDAPRIWLPHGTNRNIHAVRVVVKKLLCARRPGQGAPSPCAVRRRSRDGPRVSGRCNSAGGRRNRPHRRRGPDRSPPKAVLPVPATPRIREAGFPARKGPPVR